MKSYFTKLMLTLLLAISIPVASQQVLRASFYSQNVEPQLFFDENGRPISGILFDISHAIADHLAMDLEMIPIPRKRIEQSLVRDIIDMHCVANPKWYKSNALQWSSVIYQNPDILINRQGMTSLAALSAHKNLKIGTTLGFIYPELVPYVSNKNILPVTSLTPAESYEKYRKKQISGFISASIEASYFIKDLDDAVIPMNNNDIHCVLAPSMKKSLVELISGAVDYLKATGKIEVVLNKYRNIPNSSLQIVEVIAE